MNQRTQCDRCGEFFSPGTEFLEHRAGCGPTHSVPLHMRIRSPEEQKAHMDGFLYGIKESRRAIEKALDELEAISKVGRGLLG